MNKLFTFFFFVLNLTMLSQNVGINTAGTAANASSILDLNTGNAYASPNGKGVLFPNVALTGTGDATTVTSPATSLWVYNTATAGAGATAVTPGYYYWDGTKWVSVSGNAWLTTGNFGTTAGTNFLGTLDNQDLVFKTNNAEAARILAANGFVGIGTSAPGAPLHVNLNSNATAASISNFVRTGTGSVGWFALFSGASPGDYSALTQNGDKSFIFTNDNNPAVDASTGLVIGPWTSSSNPTGGNKGIKIMETGLVGIGTGTPNAMLDVTSTTAGFAMPRMTSVQRKAIAAPIAGLQVYDTDLKGFYFFDGTKWDCANNPAGTVQYFANVTPPDGYLECNGQAVSRTAYAELFAAIGTTYGVGDGSTTFNVPDLRGEFIRGYDDGRGADPGRTIGSWQSPSPLVHDDTYGAANQDTDFSMDHAAASYSDNWPGALAGGIPNAYWGRDNGYAPPSAWQVYSGTSAGGSAYGMISGARPRSVALMPCIKF